jgi:hypothetical protein
VPSRSCRTVRPTYVRSARARCGSSK